MSDDNGRRLIRAYEDRSLPLEERLPSLARRFPCLKKAEGLSPWAPDQLRAWAVAQGDGAAGWHAAHLILGLWGRGDDQPFDAVAAVRAWGDEDRTVFATWARSWID